VEEGEVFGFIGPNGAGKSTTIRVLLNLIYPTSGQARVLGLDAVADTTKIRAQVGYLPAEVGYYEDMRVRQLLEYSAGFYGMAPAETRRRISELAQAFELDTSRRAQDLSTGNRRKVGVVLALLHRPKLLILDEPTGGLDPLMQARLFEVLGEENARGTTVFFSSHVLSEVQRFCSRVGIIKEGRIVKTEEVSALRAAQFQKVRITFAAGSDAPLNLPGILHQERHGPRLDLLYNGDVNVLVQALGERKLQSLALEEPTLEEIFLHYYETGREPA
jgi:ABC-2 type transport system ATP-binding protein